MTLELQESRAYSALAVGRIYTLCAPSKPREFVHHRKNLHESDLNLLARQKLSVLDGIIPTTTDNQQIKTN